MGSGRLYGNTVQGVWRCYADWSDSSTDTTFTMTLNTGMQSIGWGINIHNFYADASINNQTNSVNNASFYSGNGATVYKGLVSKTVTVNRTHSAQSIGAHASVVNNTGYKNGRSDIYTTWTVPAKPSYTVSYNANGGSGAPGNQTKWYGENLTLSGTRPSRTGYSFQGWATSSGGGVAYNPGATYTGNGGLTLYAVWKANTYTVSYNANGGSGAPGNQTKTYGVTLTLSSTKPTRTNYNFLGWSTSSSATSAQYQPGGAFTTNAATTLYAVWQLAYIAPRITNLIATRCNSSGTLADDGTYAKVEFSWTTDRAVSLVRINCNGANTDISSSGTSGSVSRVVGSGALDTENSYTITVTVNDSNGSTSQQVTVAPMYYIMDFSPQGGVAFGKPAPNYKELQSAVKIRPDAGIGLYKGIDGNGTTNLWWKLGTFNSANYQGACCIIDLYGLNGQNEGTNGQCGQVRIHIIDSWDGSGYFNVMVDGTYTYLNLVNVKILAPSYSSCDVWIKTIQTYPAAYYTVQTSQSWTPSNSSGSYSSTEPSGGHSCTIKYVYPAVYRYANGYLGFEDGKSNDTDWIRTTSSGLIPYSADATNGKSSLGTSTWPFSSIYVNQLSWTGSGLKGRVWKTIWSGTLNRGGTVRVSELPHYNVFAFLDGTNKIRSIGLRTNTTRVSAIGGFNNYSFSATEQFNFTANGTSLYFEGGNYIINAGNGSLSTIVITEIKGLL